VTDLEDKPSKSELKRRMTALQELGETLVELSDRELAGIPIEDEALLRTIEEARRIRSRSARRRHLQRIGKLMRHIDPQPISEALARLHQRHQGDVRAFHALEQLRDEALAAGPAGVEIVIRQYAAADRQQLRQLLLQHQRELRESRAPAASRKLFRYLRELQQQSE
jgi:ribosome-associated protein